LKAEELGPQQDYHRFETEETHYPGGISTDLMEEELSPKPDYHRFETGDTQYPEGISGDLKEEEHSPPRGISTSFAGGEG